jgi:hypothetical protein
MSSGTILLEAADEYMFVRNIKSAGMQLAM